MHAQAASMNDDHGDCQPAADINAALLLTMTSLAAALEQFIDLMAMHRERSAVTIDSYDHDGIGATSR